MAQLVKLLPAGWHPIVLIQAPAAPLPFQLPVNVLGKQQRMVQDLELLCPHGRPEISSWLLALGQLS